MSYRFLLSIIILLAKRQKRMQSSLMFVNNVYFYDKKWFMRFKHNDCVLQINNVFRYNNETIDHLVSILQQKSHKKKKILTIHLCVFLVFIGRKISYRDLTHIFGFSHSRLHDIITEITELILLFKTQYIYLPTIDEFEILSNGFQRFSDFPGTILAIDGTFVPITNPTTTEGRYYNRKGTPSLNFLLACDSTFRIRYVFGGTYGSSHDAFIYNASSLSQWAEQNLNVLHNDVQYHILADAAYPLKQYLLTPYKGVLNNTERRFNQLIIPQRIAIERTFGYFKTKFQKFRHEIKNGHEDLTSKIFMAACIIYNATL